MYTHFLYHSFTDTWVVWVLQLLRGGRNWFFECNPPSFNILKLIPIKTKPAGKVNYLCGINFAIPVLQSLHQSSYGTVFPLSSIKTVSLSLVFPPTEGNFQTHFQEVTVQQLFPAIIIKGILYCWFQLKYQLLGSSRTQAASRTVSPFFPPSETWLLCVDMTGILHV